MKNEEEFEDDVPMNYIEERLEKLERSHKILLICFIMLAVAVIFLGLS